MTADGTPRPPDAVADPTTTAGPIAVTRPRYRCNPTALNRSLPNGVLVLPEGIEQPIAILGSGADLWHYLRVAHTFDELVDHLATMHHVDPETVRRDVAGAWAELLDLGAVVPA